MPVFGTTQFGSGGGVFEIDQSCRFGVSAELSLNYTLSEPWTFSAWIKRSKLSAESLILGASGGEIHFNSDDTLEVEGTSTTALYRDSGGWYHVYASNNGIYVNGVSVGSCTTTDLSNAKLFDDFDGYAADVHLRTGTTAVTDFGETSGTTGQWIPKEKSGGEMYLTFSNSSAMGENSGSGSDWTATNIAATDQLIDTPTNNYCTLSFTDKYSTQALQEGNLKGIGTSSYWYSAFATFPMTSGKWYAESLEVNHTGANGFPIAVHRINDLTAVNWGYYIGYTTSGYGLGYGLYSGNGVYTNGTQTVTSFGDGATGDIYQLAIDIDNNKLWVGKNNTWHTPSGGSAGDPANGTDPTYDITAGEYVYGMSPPVSENYTANFGQDSSFAGEKTAQNNADGNDQGDFYYAPPSGFLALCAANLDDSAVADSSSSFQTTTYTGNGGTQSIDQSGNQTFEPDLVWIKYRNASSSHVLTDSVRGVTKVLSSDATTAETTDADTLTGFDSDGFSLGADSKVNTNTGNFVAWQWLEGAAPGFDIVSYTGNGSARTISHSLSAVPKMIIVKNRDQADAWQVYHAGLSGVTGDPQTDYMVLNTLAAAVDSADRWNDTAPTSSVFSLGTGVEVNTNTEDYIAYLFAEVWGFSSFGYYIGNGAADGPMVHTPGMSPAWVMIKDSTGSSGYWGIEDVIRSPYNVVNTQIDANAAAAEFDSSGRAIDFLSNGFKVRTSDADKNTSGYIYLYTAFAKFPFKTSNARQ